MYLNHLTGTQVTEVINKTNDADQVPAAWDEDRFPLQKQRQTNRNRQMQGTDKLFLITSLVRYSMLEKLWPGMIFFIR